MESIMGTQFLDALRNLVPLNALTEENLRTLAASTNVASFARDTVLFREGDTDDFAIYLIDGAVTLNSVDRSITRDVSVGADSARYALAQLKPRQFSGTAKTDVTIARVDGALLDRLLTWEQAAGYEVTEYDAGGETVDQEWMLSLLRSELFQRLPTANVNALFASMETVPVDAGQVIIRQGDPGDDYYMVKEGRATVSRKSERTGKVVILNEIGEGSGFGEEALLSGTPRNATIIMKSDGVLMRLGKSAFDSLLKAPLIKWVDEAQVRSMIHDGAGVIDVRLEDEYRNGHIAGAINIPLYLLRVKANGLDSSKPYVVCCQTGNRSASAAFLLTQRGLDVFVLRGGIQALRQVQD